MSMWKWQKVQKVSRRLSIGLWLTASLWAAVLPDQIGPYSRISKGQVDISDRPVWDEYGFQTAERANYQAGDRTVSVSVWQLKDTTGALAALQWLQPGVIQHGNYVIRVESQLNPDELSQLQSKLPKVDRSANPNLPGLLPRERRVQHSERYVLGPVSLAKFEPRISADLAGFHKGAEAQIARYRTDVGEVKLLLLSYPTPQIAGDRFREFSKRSDLTARRYGPMVGVVLDAGTPDAADKMLSTISYQPNITWSEPVPKYQNPGEMIEAICILAGALIFASVVLGLLFGGFRQLFGSKFGVQAIDDNFTSLHLTSFEVSDKQPEH